MSRISKGLFITAVSTTATLGIFVGQASATTLLGTTTTVSKAGSYKTQTLSIDAAGQATCKKGNQFTAQATWYLGKVTKDSAYVDKISVTYKAVIAGKDVGVGRVNLVNGKNKAVFSPGSKYTTEIKGGRSLTQTYPIKKTVAFNKKSITLSRYFDVGMTGTEAMWCGGTQQFHFMLKSSA
ncbi:MAG TPA: hypothetical protein VIU15_02645 [Streptomyces sp.]